MDPRAAREEIRSAGRLAYRVGPNVRYPGLVRADAGEDPEEDHVDRGALTALYMATDGTNWTDGANWETDTPLAYWHGVSTDAVGRVTELGLHPII